MKIYLDVCALGRLTDDQSQQRVQDESSAVNAVLGLVERGLHEWVSSRAMELEILENPDEERRRDALERLGHATAMQELSGAVISRSLSLRLRGFGDLDALHLSAAIEAGCGALLTTDDRFISLAERTPSVPRGLVMSPTAFRSAGKNR